jgi:hypothetical protein
MNCSNKRSNKHVTCQYIDKLPEGAVPLTEYTLKNGEVRELKHLYVKENGGDPRTCYTWNSEYQYRILNYGKDGRHVQYRDSQHKIPAIALSHLNLTEIIPEKDEPGSISMEDKEDIVSSPTYGTPAGLQGEDTEE